MFAVVRMRGSVDVDRKIKETLAMLRLHKKYHCVVIPDTPSYRGMLNVVKDYVAYGEIDAETLAMLLRRRGRLVGNKPLTDEYIKENTQFNSIDEFAKAVVEGKASLKDVPGLKPVFRLHPPRGGLKNIKWHYPFGDLGRHGDIAKLLYKMR
ncbi:50S ribosomal protein L30 [Archaeoglobus veneficus]|uniref:Large ribosomal subunit protein uL30 n=1 Tax=Archaeoglobus veneficus (strain DSM 11195 / SNP6) TaxID=693661 RepID=F2KST0_ARCVS|nr:50S ribosomal protein L30 [Archaeoglobus veneficus]AEA46975.1 ribosomal protein L30P [Archaeoglobus veneficus SNP6]